MKNKILAAAVPALLMGAPHIEAKTVSWALDNLAFTDGSQSFTLNGGFTFDDTKSFPDAFTGLDIFSSTGAQIFGADASITGCDPSIGGACPNGAEFSFTNTSQYKLDVFYSGTLGSAGTAVLTGADLINESGSGLCTRECFASGGGSRLIRARTWHAVPADAWACRTWLEAEAEEEMDRLKEGSPVRVLPGQTDGARIGSCKSRPDGDQRIPASSHVPRKFTRL